ncbi:hypothetical protein ACJIZ3_025175 [Penstemon smallii]|uniref:Polygalacturonase n=1 Tax=Penstemon smallii TaxID=265156 RepID=A0ABD3TTU4_9LAMI
MALRSIISTTLSLVLSFYITEANVSSQTKNFNVINYSAIGDGKMDNTQDACEYHGMSIVMVPFGKYVLGSITFMGYYNGSMDFVIKGTIKAPTNPTTFKTNTWMGFRGNLDGWGHAAWPYNDCSKNCHCSHLPVRSNLKSINSKNAHINLFACYNMSINHLTLLAPQDSPNTDGIHIGDSSRINIYRSIIKTGDDCIDMVSGSRDIDISDILCGPGHSTSIDSLGGSPKREDVNRINVRNCTFVATQNGLRIKTWAPSSYSLASNMSFENIIMQNVRNPIIIDQNYCPYPPCGRKIRNITLNNIRGTSSTKVAVKINCSGSFQCKDIVLRDIDLVSDVGYGQMAAISNCTNVSGSSYGIQHPPACFTY